MADEPTAPAGEQPSAPQDAPAAPVEGAPAPASAPDAKSAAPATDWRDGLDGEALEFAKTSTSPQDVVKRAVELRKANSQMIRVPGKDAKPEDVAKFAKALGAGEKPEDYKFATPEGKEPSETDKLVQSKVAAVLHKHHVPIVAAGELQAVVTEVAQGLEAEQERVAKKGREESVASLRKEWGSDFDANVQLAVRAANTFGGQGFAAFLNTAMVNGIKLGDHPEFMRVFGQIGRRMGEGQFIGAVGAGDRQTLQERQAALMRAHPPGSESYKDPAVQREMREISEKLYGTETIGGRGRA